MNKKDLLDRFNEFEVEVPMLVDDLNIVLSKSKNYKNIQNIYDLKNVDLVESFYLDVINGIESVDFSLERLDRIIIAYLGETLIFHAGGNWELSLDNDFTYGTPIIRGFKYDNDGIGFSPVGIRERLLREKEKGVFIKSLSYCINKEKVQSDLMKQMIELSKKNRRK